MHSILLVVPKADKKEDPQGYARWKECADNLREQAKQNKDIQVLGENVALISLQNGLKLLLEVVHNATLDLPYKYAIFDEEIEWFEESRKA